MEESKCVERVVSNALCSGCGACVEVCEKKAIQMNRNHAGFLTVEIDHQKCISCGLCLKYCSGNRKNSSKLLVGDWENGKYLVAYRGYCTNDEIRLHSQSGGVITALLIYLLESGKIDGAALTAFDESTQITKAIWGENISDIRNASGSHYTQSNVIEEVLKHIDKRMAVVAVGCQAQTIKLLSDSNKIKRPEYVIGLVCERQYSSHIMDEFSKGEEICYYRAKDKVAGGWPGNVRLIKSNGQEKVFDRTERYLINDYYQSFRCTQCFDMNNIYSDIVCGDPWFLLQELGLENMLNGETIVVARNEKGRRLLLEAEQAGYIKLCETDGKRFLDENSVSYNKAGRTVMAQMAVDELKLPRLYDDVKVDVDRIDEVVLSYYKRWCEHSFRNYKANSRAESYNLIKSEKKKDRKKIFIRRTKDKVKKLLRM